MSLSIENQIFGRSIDLASLLNTAPLALVVVLVTLLFLALRQSTDPREPPVLQPRIPFVGHAFGIIQHGPRYFLRTAKRTDASIYSLPVPGSKIHVISDPAIMASVFRASKTLTFTPFAIEIGSRVVNLSKQARKKLEPNADGSKSKEGFPIEIHDLTIQALIPGPELNRLTSNFFTAAWTRFVKPLEDSLAGNGTRSLDLYEASKEWVTFASTGAFYGSRNPFDLKPSLSDDFWTFSCQLNPLMLTLPFERYLFPTPHLARERLVSAFAKYYSKDPSGDSSSLAEARYYVGKKSGFTSTEIARLEMGLLIGILSNTVPAVFWMLAHIWSDPALTSSIRAELDANALLEGPNGLKTLDIPALRTKCALLQSTLQETLRLHSHFASVRFVEQDMFLDNKWLLKKSTIVQMPNSVVHRKPALWGNDPETFEPQRFMRSKITSQREKGNYNIDPASHTAVGDQSTGAYRPFGGGTTMCPGRHFAAMEVLALVAVLVWRFDAEPETSWTPLPDVQYDSLIEGVFPPSRDIRVRLKRRDGVNDNFDGNVRL